MEDPSIEVREYLEGCSESCVAQFVAATACEGGSNEVLRREIQNFVESVIEHSPSQCVTEEVKDELSRRDPAETSSTLDFVHTERKRIADYSSVRILREDHLSERKTNGPKKVKSDTNTMPHSVVHEFLLNVGSKTELDLSNCDIKEVIRMWAAMEDSRPGESQGCSSRNDLLYKST